MDLWIKSKDKIKLAKIINIWIDRTTIRANTKCDDWSIELGTYKTKERALEILDDIQNLLRTTGNDVSQMVYNMPEK